VSDAAGAIEAVRLPFAATAAAAATTTRVFLASAERALPPALRARPDSLVAMDDLAPHEAARVRAAFGAAGVAHRYLPPCSPDLDPR
jgi:hypothetical protein